MDHRAGVLEEELSHEQDQLNAGTNPDQVVDSERKIYILRSKIDFWKNSETLAYTNAYKKMYSPDKNAPGELNDWYY
jgi:hypothetical protein